MLARDFKFVPSDIDYSRCRDKIFLKVVLKVSIYDRSAKILLNDLKLNGHGDEDEEDMIDRTCKNQLS